MVLIGGGGARRRGAICLIPGRVGPPAGELGASTVGFEVGEVVEVGGGGGCACWNSGGRGAVVERRGWA